MFKGFIIISCYNKNKYKRNKYRTHINIITGRRFTKLYLTKWIF